MAIGDRQKMELQCQKGHVRFSVSIGMGKADGIKGKMTFSEWVTLQDVGICITWNEQGFIIYCGTQQDVTIYELSCQPFASLDSKASKMQACIIGLKLFLYLC